MLIVVHGGARAEARRTGSNPGEFSGWERGGGHGAMRSREGLGMEVFGKEVLCEGDWA